jgi:FdhD protein
MDNKLSATACWDELTVVRIDGNRRYKRPDRLIKEESYRLCINGRFVHTFACTPIDLEELAVGYAFTEGCLADAGDIQGISVDPAVREIRLSLGNTEDPPRRGFPQEEAVFSKEAIYTLWETFNEKCSLFHITGAVHGMALTDGKEILILHEDAARHNAAAKVIGGMLLKAVAPGGKAFIFSGRLALKIVMMIERTGVKALFCHGAVTAEAAERALAAGITLAGFVRQGYMNIYTHSERITEA